MLFTEYGKSLQSRSVTVNRWTFTVNNETTQVSALGVGLDKIPERQKYF